MARNRRTRIKSVRAIVKDAVSALCANGSSSAGLVKVSTHTSFVENEKPTTHIVAEHQLAAFLTATLQLHYDPGINPGNGTKAAEALCITATKLKTKGPFWWTVPGLKREDAQNGAIIFSWETTPTILWTRPGVELPESYKLYHGYFHAPVSAPS